MYPHSLSGFFIFCLRFQIFYMDFMLFRLRFSPESSWVSPAELRQGREDELATNKIEKDGNKMIDSTWNCSIKLMTHLSNLTHIKINFFLASFPFFSYSHVTCTKKKVVGGRNWVSASRKCGKLGSSAIKSFDANNSHKSPTLAVKLQGWKCNFKGRPRGLKNLAVSKLCGVCHLRDLGGANGKRN